MNAVTQLLKFTGIDFGIFWDFPQDALLGVSASKPIFILLFCCSESVVRHMLVSTVLRSVRCSLHRQANPVAGQLAWLARRSVCFPGFRRGP
jgi:hypothetical protein